MSPQDCYDRVRFSLSDASGSLRFESFAITDAGGCRRAERALRAHLVGRALADVDPDRLGGLEGAESCGCMPAVMQAIREHKDLFVRPR